MPQCQQPKNKPMITVDKEELRMIWNYMDKDLVGKMWISKMVELSDVKSIKSDENVEFAGSLVPNIALRLQQNQFWSYTLPQTQAVPGTFSAQMKCWSQVCPDFIKYSDESNKSLDTLQAIADAKTTKFDIKPCQ